jgi:hypothetical protein
MTPIKTEHRTKTISFGEKPVESFWLETPASSHLPDVNYFEQMKEILASGVKDGVVCVFSGELSSKALCELLAKARDNGNRVYILTNDFNDEMKNLDGCLIRYGGSRKTGSFILINPNSVAASGCLFTGRFSDGSLRLAENLPLNLDNEQIPVLFRYFCHQFWERAEKERIGSEEHNIDSAPLDIYPPSGNGCDFSYLRSMWSKEMDGASITASLLFENPVLKFDNISNSNIVSLFTSDYALVRSLTQKSNKIIAIDAVCFVNSVRTGDGIWLVPKIDSAPEDEVYALLLNNEQSKILDNHIGNLLRSKNQYQYFESDLRKNLSGKTIINLGETVSQKYSINSENPVNLETHAPLELFPKSQFDNVEPDFPDDGKSVTVTYHWKNVPFCLPAGSKKHPLYQQWEDEAKKITAFLDNILSRIEAAEKKEANVAKRIFRLFLGKKTHFNDLKREIEEDLKKTDFPNLETQKVKDAFDQINAISLQIEGDIAEIDEEDRKAKIDEAIDALKAAVEKDKADAQGKREELERKEKEKQAAAAEFCSAYIEWKKTLDSADDTEKKKKEPAALKSATESKIKSFAQNYTPDDKGLAKIESELEELTGKKNREKNPAQADAADEKRKSLQAIEGRSVFIEKAQGEIEKLESSIKAKKREIEQKEKEKISAPASKPKQESSINAAIGKKPDKSNSGEKSGPLAVPALPRLPRIGTLYQSNSQNYLAIKYWEEFDAGKSEADRLIAKLCAEKEGA